MARIRTIKPEFPQSESMGRVSRDARLLFIQLWTLCDDEGRSRGDARLIKGLLYPYDEVTLAEVDTWLDELEREKCLVRYVAEGSRYLAICNWLMHQKIDKPSKSKVPAYVPPVANPREGSRDPREGSSGDQGSKDQGSEDLDLLGARATFAECQRRYPESLARGDHWLLAERAVALRLEEGVRPSELIFATDLYREQQIAMGKVGTGAVLRPQNFYDTGWRGPFPLPKTKAEIRQDDNIRAGQEWLAQQGAA